MRKRRAVLGVLVIWMVTIFGVKPSGNDPAQQDALAQSGAASCADDPVRALVARLDLENTRPPSKGLTDSATGARATGPETGPRRIDRSAA